MVVVTQEDKARADFRRVLAELRDEFGEHLWALELPLGEEAGFRAIADVLSERPTCTTTPATTTTSRCRPRPRRRSTGCTSR
jgi:hypothetical protein